ncbi:MAG: deoxyhypusine synthase [Candidatus Hadarchaeum sp.]|uniref:deoxyhypusine synthase n=1 Tax=Candidatus Hadarchaeum sp. TaxID=2883567 RepID=UPI0031733857
MRSKFLKTPTHPIEVQPGRSISHLTEGLLATGFQGRKLGEAVEVWAKMLREKQNIIWLGLAGAMVPAGMRKVISYLIKRRMIDVLVSTGANLYHDLHEARGKRHYVGSHLVDDVKLRKHYVDRIYDVFADETEFYRTDLWIEKEFCPHLSDMYRYSSREIIYELGKFLDSWGAEKDSIILSAYHSGVPVFCPALNDSSLGFSLMFANRRRGRRIILDSLKDVDESSRITEVAGTTSVVYIGGGVPKNFIQQTAVIAGYQTRHDRSHKYALQISMDAPMWGGLSGCTFEEAQSWGKIDLRAKKVMCYADATIALPIVAHALGEKFKKLRRDVPVFEWGRNGTLTIKYEKRSL